MFIDAQTYKVNGKTYRRVLLRNSYRKNGKTVHDTIANLSKCSEQEIQAMLLAFNHKKNLQPLQTSLSSSGESLKQGLSFGAVWLLYQLSKRYGIDRALGNTQEGKRVLWMVIAALIGSTSRLSITRLAQTHAACDILGLDSFCEDDLYKDLDWLGKRQEKIELQLFKHHYPDKSPSLFLYDVTSSYFEGDQNELAEYGYNRDGKKGKKQIVIGLLTDEDGRPIACEVFKGNTQDTKTFENQVNKVAHRFGIKTVTFVGDRGMIKNVQIEKLSSEHFHYITAITKPQILKMLDEGQLQYELFDENLTEVILAEGRYILKKNPVREKEIHSNKLSKYRSVMALCNKKNSYLNEHPKAKPEKAKKHLEDKIKRLQLESWVSVDRKDRTLTIEKDEKKFKEDSLLDGCYVIKTDLPESDCSKEIVHGRYKSLSGVEWAFRTLKTTFLHMRGIFVRKETSTRAHVFVMTMAYLIAYELRRLWVDLEVTAEEGVQALSQLCVIEKKIENVSMAIIPEPRDDVGKLLNKAKVTLPDAIPNRHIKVYTRKKLVEERRT